MDEIVYQEGYNAFSEGKSNPYKRGSRAARDFALGYVKAREEYNLKIERLKHGRR